MNANAHTRSSTLTCVSSNANWFEFIFNHVTSPAFPQNLKYLEMADSLEVASDMILQATIIIYYLKMSIYMDGRVRLIAVVLKTTYPEMGTRVQIPIHVSAQD